MDPDEQIFRHEPREREFEAAIGDEALIEEVSGHVERHLGPISMVHHEVISDLVHIDVHEVGPTADRPFITLVTTGMAERPMAVPAEALEQGVEEHAELMVTLPPDWPLRAGEGEPDPMEDERNFWPLRWLKILARLPHEFETWLGSGHTVPNGDPPQPFAENTEQCCMMLAPPVSAPAEFWRLTLADGRRLRFWSMAPLYREEVDFKLRKGAEALFDRFNKAGISDVVDPVRPNVCGKRRWF